MADGVPSVLMQWLSVVQTIATLLLIPLVKLFVGMRDDVRDVRRVVVGTPEARAEGLLSRVQLLEQIVRRLQREVDHVYGVLRLLHPDLPERMPRLVSEADPP